MDIHAHEITGTFKNYENKLQYFLQTNFLFILVI